MNNLSIRARLFLYHAIALVLAIAAMAIHNYQSQMTLLLETSTRYHQDVAQSLIPQVSLAIAGNNYGNLSLPTFKQSLINRPALLYLAATGTSDFGTPYGVSYRRSEQQVTRTYYPTHYEQELTQKIAAMQEALGQAGSADKKLQFILDRSLEELGRYRDSRQQPVDPGLAQLLQADHRVDLDLWLLKVTVPTQNLGQGTLTLVFDIAGLQQVRSTIVRRAIIEFTVAMVVALPLIGLAGGSVVRPIAALTACMAKEIKEIDVKRIPAVTEQNELGVLARSFQSLLIESRAHIRQIETLSKTDALTGLYNRHHYRAVVDPLIAHAVRTGQVLSFIYLDIDNFKKYNDHYGHGEGDQVLKAVAGVIRQASRRLTDHCFRFGGEEFLVVIAGTTPDLGAIVSERIRSQIQALGIAHSGNEGYGCITASVGVCSVAMAVTSPPSHESLVSAADEQLYLAKRQGRNRVVLKHYPELATAPANLTAQREQREQRDSDTSRFNWVV